MRPFAHRPVGRPIPPRIQPSRIDPGGTFTAGIERRAASPFWALMLLSAIMFLSPAAYFPVLAPLRVALVSAIFALAMLLVDRLRTGEPLITARPEIRWGLALVGWSILTVPFSVWRGGSIEY